MEQPKLFEKKKIEDTDEAGRLALFALGEFQARGKVLAARQLPLDRLRGALRRAAQFLDAEELSDEAAVAALAALGVQVSRVPSYVAKHPYRVTVPATVAENARRFYDEKSVEVKES